jgi:hypothetical protein
MPLDQTFAIPVGGTAPASFIHASLNAEALE